LADVRVAAVEEADGFDDQVVVRREDQVLADRPGVTTPPDVD